MTRRQPQDPRWRRVRSRTWACASSWCTVRPARTPPRLPFLEVFGSLFQHFHKFESGDETIGDSEAHGGLAPALARFKAWVRRTYFGEGGQA